MIRRFGNTLRKWSKKWIGRGLKLNLLSALILFPILLVINMYWYLFLGLLWALYIVLLVLDRLVFSRFSKKAEPTNAPHIDIAETHDLPVTPTTIEPAVQETALPQNSAEEKTHKVAGIPYHIDEFMKLSSLNDEYSMKKSELIERCLTETRIWKYDFYWSKVDLVPEPDNPADPNAIKVVVDGHHIGYIKKGSCAHIHKLINENRIQSIGCKLGGGKYKYLTEECDEDGEVTYRTETDEFPFYAHVKIIEKQ